MMDSPSEYHLRELRIASDATDLRRSLPDVPAACRRILDIGGGAGQTLIALNLDSHVDQVAMDVDRDALRLGMTLSDRILFVQGAGERLPFPTRSFDFVLCRVALPYMNIPLAIGEIKRVLRPGGGVWFTLHPLSMLSIPEATRSVHQAVFEAYRLLNCASLHVLGWQFGFLRRRFESYQTEGGMRRVLERHGFGEIRFQRSEGLAVTAVYSDD